MIILAFVAVMAGFGYAPTVALGLVTAAAAIAEHPAMARAALGA